MKQAKDTAVREVVCLGRLPNAVAHASRLVYVVPRGVSLCNIWDDSLCG